MRSSSLKITKTLAARNWLSVLKNCLSQLDVLGGYVLVIGAAFAFSIPQALPNGILETHVQEFSLTSTRFQTIFYLMVALTASVCILSQHFLNIPPRVEGPHRYREVMIKIFFAVVLIRSEPMIGLAFVFASHSLEDSGQVLPRRSNPLQMAGFLMISLAMINLIFRTFIVPIKTGLTSSTDLDSSIGVSSHYSMTFLPGLVRSSLFELVAESRSNYGLFMPLFAWLSNGIYRSTFGENLPPMTVVAIAQIVAIFVIALTFIQISKRFWKIGLLVTVVAIPNLSLMKLSAPNTLGIRYLPLLLLILIATTLIKRGSKSGLNRLVLGVVTGLMTQLSPEFVPAALGISLGVVLIPGVSLLPSIQRVVRETIFLFGYFALTALFTVLIQTVFFNRKVDESIQFLALFAGGYGGLGIRWIPVAGLLFMLALSQLRKSFRNTLETDGQYQGLSLGMSFAIITWLPYYINRMDNNNNLWFLILLGILILYISWSHSHDSLTSEPVRLVASMLIVGLMGLSLSSHLNPEFLPDYTSCSRTQSLVSRACLTTQEASHVSEKFKELPHSSNSRSMLILSALSAEVALIGYNSSSPYNDWFGEIGTKEEFIRASNWISVHRPPLVLVDANENRRSSQFHSLITETGLYELSSDVSNHWVEYRLKKD